MLFITTLLLSAADAQSFDAFGEPHCVTDAVDMDAICQEQGMGSWNDELCACEPYVLDNSVSFLAPAREKNVFRPSEGPTMEISPVNPTGVLVRISDENAAYTEDGALFFIAEDPEGVELMSTLIAEGADAWSLFDAGFALSDRPQ